MGQLINAGAFLGGQLNNLGPPVGGQLVNVAPPGPGAPPSQPQLWCTGPVHVYLGGYDPGKPPQYLGTGQEAPDIDLRPHWKAILTDLGGSEVPTDQVWQGEDAMISLTLNRWSETVLAVLCTQPNVTGALAGNNANLIRGVNLPGDVGSLVLSESLSFILYLVFPFAAKPVMAPMVPGYRFPASKLVGQTWPPGGTKNRKVRLAFHALRLLNTADATKNAYGTGSLTCYDFAVGNVPLPS